MPPLAKSIIADGFIDLYNRREIPERFCSEIFSCIFMFDTNFSIKEVWKKVLYENLLLSKSILD
jgi:hypothetical protein